ncbi:hypothetical protein [uncultured Chryseobacterium sp.]|uniref:hypothetical protein n=1 Tax=uncultured Chryseobacterium sp. TaxID=259322 RepID=UPI00374A715C
MKNVHIPNPCSEHWEMMSPQEKGRFCSVCNKCVIDFTQKQPNEIRQMIDEKKDEEICGRFYNHQLNTGNPSEKLKAKFFKYIPAHFQNSRIVLTVLSVILFLTGCSKQKEESFATTGLLRMEEDSIPENKNYVMGEAKIDESDSCMKISKKDSVVTKNTSSKKSTIQHK